MALHLFDVSHNVDSISGLDTLCFCLTSFYYDVPTICFRLPVVFPHRTALLLVVACDVAVRDRRCECPFVGLRRDAIGSQHAGVTVPSAQ